MLLLVVIVVVVVSFSECGHSRAERVPGLVLMVGRMFMLMQPRLVQPLSHETMTEEPSLAISSHQGQ